MRKIFLDLGTHSGQTLEMAIERYTNCDLYIGVEPVPCMFDKAVARMNKFPHKNIELYRIAVDALDVPEKTVTLYEDLSKGNNHLGSSLFADKTMRKNQKIEVKCVNINHFFQEHFRAGDSVILKSDIEAGEYKVLDALINSGNLKKYVRKIWIEWHYAPKVPSISKKQHLEMVKRIQDLGYPITGDSKKDEFYDQF